MRLANPPSNNLTLSLLETLREELSQAREDSSVRCLVLASAYPRYFSTGLDPQEIKALPEGRRFEPFLSLLEAYRQILEFPKPTLAVLSGSAVLGGWILAMACDFRLMGREHGKISLSEIRFGLSPTACLIQRMREISSSPFLVKEMVLKGKALRAEQALEGNFVDALAPGETLDAQALSEARRLASAPLPAYLSVKKALQGPSAPGFAALWQDSLRDFERIVETAEAREGIAAMVEKRRPRWQA